jgi:hypothetical protein
MTEVKKIIGNNESKLYDLGNNIFLSAIIVYLLFF